MRVPARRLLLAPLLASLLACELSTGLISETERRSIYALEFVVEGAEAEGDVAAAPGDSVQVSLAPLRGAEAARLLSLSLSDATGEAVASLSYVSALGRSAGLAGDEEATSALTVERLDGLLPRFALPEKLEPGSYVLKARLVGADGSSLHESTLSIHVVPDGFSAGELSVYPPAPAPGSPVLLSIEPRILRGADEAESAAYGLANEVSLSEGGVASARGEPVFDPWIRWSSGSRLIAEGRLSEGADRVAWASPAVEGAYGIAVDLFPDPPSDRLGSSPVSPWREEGRVVAKAPEKAPASPFAASSRFHVLYSFDLGLENRGAEAGAGALQPVGRPRLEAYSGGFGYRLGSTSGFRMEGSVWPRAVSGERLSLYFRLSPDRLEGVIAEFAEPGAGFVLRVGIAEGRPYVESSGESGSVFRSVAVLDLIPGPLDLQLELRESKDGLSPLWTAAPVGRGPARKARSAPLPGLGMAALSSGAVLSLGGGAQSLSGIYDEFGILAESSPPSLLTIAYRERYDDHLLAAADFAAGAPSLEGFSLLGRYSLTEGALRLEAGASIAVPTGFRPMTDYALVMDLGRAVKSTFSLHFLDEAGAVLLRLDADGLVTDPFGKALGKLGQEDGSSLSLSWLPTEGGWSLSSGGVAAGPFSLDAPASLRLSALSSAAKESGYVEILALSLVGEPDRALAAAPKSQLSLP